MDIKDKLAQFKALDGNRFIDEDKYIVSPYIVQVYMQAGRYSHPCRICGIYAELYINGDKRRVFIENGTPYRADLEIGTIDTKGYFHYTAE